MKIQPITHGKGDRNRFCGPAVISAVTGMHTGEAARLIRVVTGKKRVTGTHSHQIAKAFQKCNVLMTKVPVIIQKPTLVTWLRENKERRTTGRVYLLAAGNHWQIITGRRYACGKVKELVPVTDERVKRRARVTGAWELVATGKIVIPAEARKPEPANDWMARRKRERARARPKAKALAAQIGVIIEKETGLDSNPWFVYHPNLEDDCDPYYDDHYALDWTEVLDRVEGYAEALQLKHA